MGYIETSMNNVSSYANFCRKVLKKRQTTKADNIFLIFNLIMHFLIFHAVHNSRIESLFATCITEKEIFGK